MSRSAGLVLVLAAVALGQCGSCREEDRIDGVIDSPTPMKTPIGNLDACAVRVRVEYYRQISSSGSSSSNRSWSELSETRYAPGATFTVYGKRLVIHGSGGTPSFLAFRLGEATWGWGSGPVPPALRGWGPEHDRLLAIAGGESPPGSIKRITFIENFIPCGADVSLRGVVGGDHFVLVPEKLPPGARRSR
jgi:hypothetical protein